jgi:hypothetical protein
MKIPEREDIYESKRLSDSLNLEPLSYQNSQCIMTGFCKEILLPKMNEYGVDRKIIKLASYIIGRVSDFLKGKISSLEVDQCLIFARIIRDNEDNGSREYCLMEIIAFITGSNCEEYDNYGSEMFFDAFFFLLHKLGTGFCKQFTDHVKKIIAFPYNYS